MATNTCNKSLCVAQFSTTDTQHIKNMLKKNTNELAKMAKHFLRSGTNFSNQPHLISYYLLD